VAVKERFDGILTGLERIAAEFNMPVIYPIHPRARKVMSQLGIQPKGIELIEPLDYHSFLQLDSQAKVALTDSGGVQEETCILKVPCVTLRDNTERPETLTIRSNVLAGTDPEKILGCTATMLSKANEWANPFGDGTADERILGILKQQLER
jgi:UDP-N-acetylglucosamine 2-epimerase (non-hydrolysing)